MAMWIRRTANPPLSSSLTGGRAGFGAAASPRNHSRPSECATPVPLPTEPAFMVSVERP